MVAMPMIKHIFELARRWAPTTVVINRVITPINGGK